MSGMAKARKQYCSKCHRRPHSKSNNYCRKCWNEKKREYRKAAQSKK